MKSRLQSTAARSLSLLFLLSSTLCVMVGKNVGAQQSSPLLSEPAFPAHTEVSRSEDKASGQAKEDNAGKIGTSKAEVEAGIGMVPWIFVNGSDEAVSSSQKTIQQILNRTHLPLKTDAGLNALVSETSSEAMPELPTPEAMVRAGLESHVRYVVAGRSTWSSRRVWVNLGYQIKVACLSTVRVVDVEQQQVVFEIMNVTNDAATNNSRSRSRGLFSIGFLELGPSIRVAGESPRDLLDQRAADSSLRKTFQLWMTALNRVRHRTAVHSNKDSIKDSIASMVMARR